MTPSTVVDFRVEALVQLGRDIPNKIVENIIGSVASRIQIEFMSSLIHRMNINYIGSKKSLLEKMESVLKQNIKLKSSLVFGNLFSGTGVVGEYFNQKFGMQIISNDSEYSSYILNYAKLKCPYNEKLHRIFQRWNKWLNKISQDGLFSQNYAYRALSQNVVKNSPNRNFFLQENAQKIDGIRILIERYYLKNKLTSPNISFY